jgi:hypothetical protein
MGCPSFNGTLAPDSGSIRDNGKIAVPSVQSFQKPLSASD